MTSINMERRIFEELFDTLKSGTKFTATIESAYVEGKVEVSREKKRIWLCFNKGPHGDTSPNKHGYTSSWVITHDTYLYVKEFTIIDDTSDSMVDTGNYPVGTYVVLLSVGTGKKKYTSAESSIPTDHVYKLRKVYTKGESFLIEKDAKGHTSNGYSGNDLEVRAATEYEIAAYNTADFPCPAVGSAQAQSTPQIINNYEIY